MEDIFIPHDLNFPGLSVGWERNGIRLPLPNVSHVFGRDLSEP